MDTGFSTFVTKEALALTDADLLPNGKIRSMEKAKANNLLRQLQLRLQYARLKVDHGWQKQRLNEVENLYFRQLKQSDSPFKPTYPTTALLSTPLDPQILAQSQPEDSGPNSSLSFKLPAPSEAPEALANAPPNSTATPASHEHANGGSQWPVSSVNQEAPQSGLSSQIPPPLPQGLSSWVHDVPDPALAIVAPAVPVALTTPSQFLPSSRPQQASVPGPSAPLTYESFWSSSSSVVPLPQPLDGQWQTAQGVALAPGFTPTPFAPRNGKGKGRVAGGSVVKRKSPIVTQSGYAVV
ncbi:hypothetical protein C8R45DRAFT_1108790 [Mycena sanguinolenta]|nr:hypothetical protein C8R45DRAFT_1108790 [Mycena sanguinolenta]